MKREFNLEYWYREYLRMVKLPEHSMHPVQRVETKRAFMAGCGVMLQLMHNEIPELPQDEAVEMLENMTSQVSQYFKTESKGGEK